MLSVSALSDRVCYFLLVIASMGLVGGGLLIGEMARVQPCHLCILQRVIYLAYGFVALGGVVKPGWRKLWGPLLMLVAVGGIAAAGEQSWMQYAPQLVTECGFGDPTPTEQLVAWLGGLWPAMFMVTGFCTQKDWIFLGLSLANWSVFCFLALFVAAVWMRFIKKGPAAR